ncbi:MAG: SEL1-like repeat protein, partial [Proteobacteria bacterium]|nr:SEL1-like repeat protein [Pseudomonadota bacterium]
QILAAQWYLRAAEGGFALAQTNLGIMYQYGQGVRQDFPEALRWYRLAAARDDALAQNNLGLMYANGLGVERDFVEAYKWFELAAREGGESTELATGSLSRLTEVMSQEEIAAARARAQAFREAAAAAAQEAALESPAVPRGADEFGLPVLAAQRALKQLGYYDGRVDGLAGPMTESAIRTFQRDLGLASDGGLSEAFFGALAEAQGRADGAD